MEEDQKRLADALEELKEHNFMKIHESAWKFMYYNLLRGLAIGLELCGNILAKTNSSVNILGYVKWTQSL